MGVSLAGNRYAQSLLDLAIEQNQLDTVFNDMELIASTIEGSKELSILLDSPVVKSEKKQTILNQLFGSKISELSTRFLKLVSTRKRDSLLQDITTSFITMYKKHKDIVVAEITSAVKLNDNQKKNIIALLKTDATVEMVEKIDPSILGGFIVRVDDKQIDASILREINDLKQALIN